MTNKNVDETRCFGWLSFYVTII